MANPPPDHAAEAAELASSGLFDAAWYLAVYPDAGTTTLDPALHYARHGWQEQRRPNPYFDPAWYLASYPDVGAAGMNPLLHYLRHGDLEGRQPMPFFAPAWYRKAYELAGDQPALRHFLPRRTSGRFAPCARLYAVAFLPHYRDLPARRHDPFRQYLDDREQAGEEAFPDIALLTGSGLLDANYYLINGSDVFDAQLDPALHFCRHGWHERRKPNIYFDTGWYLKTNPRVAELGLNPLVHYACEGEAAGRRPVPYFDPPWYRDTYRIPPGQSSLAHYLANRRSQKFSPTPMFDVAWYVARHATPLGPHRDPFAHYLQASRHDDVDPSPHFDAAAYRRQAMGGANRSFRSSVPAETEHPLIHYLHSHYR